MCAYRPLKHTGLVKDDHKCADLMVEKVKFSVSRDTTRDFEIDLLLWLEDNRFLVVDFIRNPPSDRQK
jgi:hypothetical protein